MKRHRFRKAHIICRDKQIIGEFEMVNLYKSKSYAESVCKSLQEREIADSQMEHRKNKGQKITVFTVHSFYLVHESLFDEILSKHCSEIINGR